MDGCSCFLMFSDWGSEDETSWDESEPSMHKLLDVTWCLLGGHVSNHPGEDSFSWVTSQLAYATIFHIFKTRDLLLYLHNIILLFYRVEQKVFAFFKWKFNHFLNKFTIFNQLYNFHCFLLPSPNVSQAFQFRPCKNFLVAYAISSKMQKLSVQPNTYMIWPSSYRYRGFKSLNYGDAGWSLATQFNSLAVN
jgi:hypothetical protein